MPLPLHLVHPVVLEDRVAPDIVVEFLVGPGVHRRVMLRGVWCMLREALRMRMVHAVLVRHAMLAGMICRSIGGREAKVGMDGRRDIAWMRRISGRRGMTSIVVIRAVRHLRTKRGRGLSGCIFCEMGQAVRSSIQAELTGASFRVSPPP